MNEVSCTLNRDVVSSIFIFSNAQDLLNQSLVCTLWAEIIENTSILKQKVNLLNDVRPVPKSLMSIFGGPQEFSELPRLNEGNPVGRNLTHRIMIGKDKCQKIFIAFKLISITHNDEVNAIVFFENGKCSADCHRVYGGNEQTFLSNVQKLISDGSIEVKTYWGAQETRLYALDYV